MLKYFIRYVYIGKRPGNPFVFIVMIASPVVNPLFLSGNKPQVIIPFRSAGVLREITGYDQASYPVVGSAKLRDQIIHGSYSYQVFHLQKYLITTCLMIADLRIAGS